MDTTMERNSEAKPQSRKLSTAEQELKALQTYVKKITSSKEDSRELLQRAGILDKKGELTEPYRA